METPQQLDDLPHLFRLPAETRLHIYSYLISNEGLYIDLCATRRAHGDSYIGRSRSIMSNLLQQTVNLHTLVRTNGLHLLLVCRQSRFEILPLLAETTVRFHCGRCFAEFLENFCNGLKMGIKWMKRVHINLDLTTSIEQPRIYAMTLPLAKARARDTMMSAKRTAWVFYGRMDLLEKERWKYEPIVEKKEVDEEDENEGLDPSIQAVNANLQNVQLPGTGAVGGPFAAPPHIQNSWVGPEVPHMWLITGEFDC